MGFNKIAADAQGDDEAMDNDEDFVGQEEPAGNGANTEEQKGQSYGTTLELDIVNKHECMKNIKRCLDKMQELFTDAWQEAGNEELPEFMQALLRDVEAPETHLNVKIFILKLLVNNS